MATLQSRTGGVPWSGPCPLPSRLNIGSSAQPGSRRAWRDSQPTSIECVNLGERRFGAAPDIFGMATHDVVYFAALTELLFEIAASGFEQAVETGKPTHVCLQKRFGHEIADDFSNFGRRCSRIRTHRAGGVKRECSREQR